MTGDPYYSLPLSFEPILKGEEAPRIPLRESIYQHIYLLMVTHYKSHRFSESYGNLVWDFDFSQMSSIKWKDLIRDAMAESIRQHESRLSGVKVTAELDEFEVMQKKQRYVRKRIGVVVEGIITLTNEPFSFHERIFIAPMSAD